MSEWTQYASSLDVPEAEYLRLLGYPSGAMLSERARELADAAREWYRDHGKPWIYTRSALSLKLPEGAVEIEGVAFHSNRLRAELVRADTHALFLAVVSAGPEAEQETHRLWQDGKPDEYFFLEMFASAVVEQLVVEAGAALCAWADAEAMAVLPHFSPGYSEWDVTEQGRLLSLIRANGVVLPGELEALDSGALRPKKSQVAVFGITRHGDRTARRAGLVPCRQCPLPGCPYRRLPDSNVESYVAER